MSGYPLTEATVMQCPHGGIATISPSQSAVTMQGALAATDADPITVVGCVFTLPNGQPSPCVTVQWQYSATMVSMSGQPVLLQPNPSGTGPGLCLAATQNPQGPPMVNTVQLVARGE